MHRKQNASSVSHSMNKIPTTARTAPGETVELAGHAGGRMFHVPLHTERKPRMAQKLFEYAVLYHPRAKKEQRDAGEDVKSKIITEPVTLLAKDEKIAMLLAARSIPKEYEGK